jgi:hypothetical protein
MNDRVRSLIVVVVTMAVLDRQVRGLDRPVTAAVA